MYLGNSISLVVWFVPATDVTETTEAEEVATTAMPDITTNDVETSTDGRFRSIVTTIHQKL